MSLKFPGMNASKSEMADYYEIKSYLAGGAAYESEFESHRESWLDTSRRDWETAVRYRQEAIEEKVKKLEDELEYLKNGKKPEKQSILRSLQNELNFWREIGDEKMVRKYSKMVEEEKRFLQKINHFWF